MEWPEEIPAIFYFAIILNRHRRHFFADPEFDFLIPTEEKLSHCDTESDFHRRAGQENLTSMVSSPVLNRQHSSIY
jgi:hypothetical protein